MFKPILLGLLTFATLSASAQQLGISSGIAIDASNNGKFKQVPISLQLVTGSSPRVVAPLIKLDAGIPLVSTRGVQAYTLQPGLAPSTTIQESIKNAWYAASIGLRIRPNPGNGERYFFADILPLGFANQRFRISYKDYDDTNYEILNPDTDLNKSGYFAGAGFGFVMNDFVAQVHGYTPLVASKGDYKLSYKFNAPISITIGYLIDYGKK